MGCRKQASFAGPDFAAVGGISTTPSVGTWEDPTPVEKTKALKLLKQMSITNIHVKVLKP